MVPLLCFLLTQGLLVLFDSIERIKNFYKDTNNDSATVGTWKAIPIFLPYWKAISCTVGLQLPNTAT